MTQFEKQQPSSTFVNAGRNAFKVGIHFLSNPYTEQPFRKLWEKGYTAESRKHNQRRR